MKPYQREFIRLAIDAGALTFGSFTLKSGRVSPVGVFCTGAQLSQLSDFYAQALMDAGIEFDVLFGPAYKGIPLVTALSLTLHRITGRDVPFAYDRKQQKDHGEGGVLVGTPLSPQSTSSPPLRVLIVDDVITAGTAITHARTLIQSQGACVCGCILALDRQERIDETRESAVGSLRNSGVSVVCVVSMEMVVGYLRDVGWDLEEVGKIEVYRDEYGV